MNFEEVLSLIQRPNDSPDKETKMTMIDSNQETKYIRAKEKVAALRKFYSSLITYILMIFMLAGINYYHNAWSYAWFLWAAFGWGIGLVFQAIKTFGLNPFFSKNWEQRKIEEFMKEDERTKRWE